MLNYSNSINTNESHFLRPSRPRFIQNFVLIWLDSNINDSNKDYQNSIVQLRRIVTAINTFTDTDECIDFLTEIKVEKVFMIVSDTFAKQLVSLIHDIHQLYSIYVFCGDTAKHEVWTNDWTKVKGFFTEIELICNLLKRNTQQCDHDLSPISIVSPSDYLKPDLNELEPSFMYSQVLKEILLGIEHSPTAKGEFVRFCRDYYTDDSTLRVIDEFERDYDHLSVIWWYTRDCFIYTMLNRALRLQEINTILKMGFFMRDLHRQIEKLYKHLPEKLIIYRGQGLSNVDFEKMHTKVGGLLSFNSFLSTSTDRQVSLCYAESSREDHSQTGILFQISIDATATSTPFASVDTISYFQSENEILFSMHAIFRIDEMKEIDNRLWEVQLILTNDNDEQLKILTDCVREETSGLTGLDRLGQLMMRMGESNRAEEVYRILLETISATDAIHLSTVYNQLGWIKNSKGNFKEALWFYQKTIEIIEKMIPFGHFKLALIYNNVGFVHSNMGDYSSALSFYQKALQILEKQIPPNHSQLALIYNNIGGVHNSMEDYSSALSFYQKTLEIMEKILPFNHPHLAQIYNNIGTLHERMGHYSSALAFVQKAIVIREKFLPPNHPDLAETYNNIGKLHDNLGDYLNALSFHQKAFEIRQKSLPPDHPDLAQTYNNIGSAYHNMGDYLNALPFYQKTLEIRQKSLPPDHPHLANVYNNIADLCKRVEDYSSALLYLQMALQIFEKSFPPNHPSLALAYNNIGLLYSDMGDYSNALLFCQKALEIRQKSLPPNHPHLAQSYNSIGGVYSEMGDNARALSFFERALETVRGSLPDNHQTIKLFQQNITVLREKL
jgi:tetratricopeptide (TPR) repeat protein